MPKKFKGQDFAQKRLRVDAHQLGHHGAMLQIQIRDDRLFSFDCKLSFRHIVKPQLRDVLVRIGEDFEDEMDDVEMAASGDMEKYAASVAAHLARVMDVVAGELRR